MGNVVGLNNSHKSFYVVNQIQPWDWGKRSFRSSIKSHLLWETLSTKTSRKSSNQEKKPGAIKDKIVLHLKSEWVNILKMSGTLWINWNYKCLRNIIIEKLQSWHDWEVFAEAICLRGLCRSNMIKRLYRADMIDKFTQRRYDWEVYAKLIWLQGLCRSNMIKRFMQKWYD